MGIVAAVLLPALALVAAAADEGEETEEPEERLAVTYEEVFTFTDERIVESSGLAVRDGLFMTVNDFGHPGWLFTVDPVTGDTIGVARWDRASYDFEALAPAGDGHVWVGDIGDNRRARDTVWVHRVPYGPGDRTVEVQSYELDYPDGRHDAEALLRHPQTGQLFIASKEVEGGRLYAVPEELREGEVHRMRGAGQVMAAATGGDFFPDGRHLIIRGYSQAVIYTWPEMDELATVDLPFQPQGEALGIDEEGRLFLTSEGLHQPVLEIFLPEEIHDEVYGIEPEPEPEDIAPASERAPLWAYAFMAAMGLAVLYAVVRLGIGFFKEDD
jgi:hypothetical protein